LLEQIARHAVAIEAHYHTDEIERVRSLSFVLMDLWDVAGSTNLPPEITTLLAPVYAYLGDPL
jgi:hypothetical protein